ncbi:MAG: hypothetical protein LC737_02905, partial [Chloroflexi bacterium]|nr:hypothetical protein [Chloroflexota bacterium]
DVIPNPQLLADPNPFVNTLLQLVGFSVCIVLLPIGFAVRHQFNSKQHQSLLVLGGCIAVPCALALLSGSPLVAQPQWLLRSILYVCPLLFMLLAAISSHSRWQLPLLGTIVLINCLCLRPYYTRYTRGGDETVLLALNQRASANDLIIADPWYMHDFIRYHYPGTAPFTGYDEEQGWLDVAQMERSNEFKLFYLSSLPSTQGDVYVFYRNSNLRWVGMVSARHIFVNDPLRHEWREYTTASVNPR